jgi:surface carbohydrate biosynthesis protein
MANYQLLQLLTGLKTLDDVRSRSVEICDTLGVASDSNVETLALKAEALVDEHKNTEAATVYLVLAVRPGAHDQDFINAISHSTEVGLPWLAARIVEHVEKNTEPGPDLCWVLTKHHFAHDNFKLARRRLEQAAQSYARFPEAAATILIAVGQAKKALDVLYKSTLETQQLLPSRFHALWLQAISESGTLFTGVRSLLKLAEIDASNPNLLLQIGFVYEAIGDLPRAAEYADKSAALSGGRLEPFILRARVSLLSGQGSSYAATVFDEVWNSALQLVKGKLDPAPEMSEIKSSPGESIEPFIYLPIELAGRELQTRLLLSVFASAEGFTTFVANRYAFERCVGELPPGVLLHKSANAFDLGLAIACNRSGHKFCFSDEEAFGWNGGPKVMVRNIDIRTLRHVALVFAPGVTYANAIRGILDANSEISVSGNLRTDLLKVLRQTEDQKHQPASRSQVLICTNFGGWNAAYSDLGAVCTNALSAVGPKVSVDYLRWLSDTYKEGTQAEALNTIAVIKLVTAISQRCPELKIVVRPHPAESRHAWEQVFRPLKRVQIDRNLSFFDSIGETSVVIHLPGCATGIEAALYGVPTIAFDTVGDLSYPKMGLSYALSERCLTTDSVIEYLERVQTSTAKPLVFDRSRLGETLHIGEDFVSRSIVRELKRFVGTPKADRSEEAFLRLKLADAAVLGISSANPHLTRRKRMTASLPSLENDVIRFSNFFGLPVPSVSASGDGVYRISPAIN